MTIGCAFIGRQDHEPLQGALPSLRERWPSGAVLGDEAAPEVERIVDGLL